MTWGRDELMTELIPAWIHTVTNDSDAPMMPTLWRLRPFTSIANSFIHSFIVGNPSRLSIPTSRRRSWRRTSRWTATTAPWQPRSQIEPGIWHRNYTIISQLLNMIEYLLCRNWVSQKYLNIFLLAYGVKKICQDYARIMDNSRTNT